MLLLPLLARGRDRLETHLKSRPASRYFDPLLARGRDRLETRQRGLGEGEAG